MTRMFQAVFDTTGQICMAIKRIYVHRSRYQEVIDGLSKNLEKTVLGSGLAEGTTMGPLHSPRQRDFVKEIVEEARAAGAEVRSSANCRPRRGCVTATSSGPASCWIRIRPSAWSRRSNLAPPSR